MITKLELELIVSPEEAGIRFAAEEKRVYCPLEEEWVAKLLLRPVDFSEGSCTAEIFSQRLDIWNTVQTRIILGRP